MDNSFFKKYHTVEKGMNIDYKNPYVFLSGLRRAINKLEPNPKIEWVVRHIEHSELKTLIYSFFKDSGINILKKRMDTLGIRYVDITGELSIKERNEAVRKYNSDEVRIMFVTKSGSQGIDLKGTRDIILLEPSWNTEAEKQIIGRGSRIGSHDHLPPKERFVTVYHLQLIKPKVEGVKYKIQSSDEMINKLKKEKQKESNRYLEIIKSVGV